MLPGDTFDDTEPAQPLIGKLVPLSATDPIPEADKIRARAVPRSYTDFPSELQMHKPGERQAIIWCDQCKVQHQDGVHVRPVKQERMQVLQEREKEYGSFKRIASVAQSIKTAIDDEFEYHNEYPSSPIQESLHLIATKLGRLSQNPSHKDSWLDIIGYANLALEEINTQTGI